MNTKHEDSLDPQPQAVANNGRPGHFRIGLAANYADTEETRFLLTPEACGMLTSAGIDIDMESGAAVDISFTDDVYAEYGVRITSREEALKADIVLAYASLRADDIRKMRRGAALLCMMDTTMFEREVIQAVAENEISVGCLDNMVSHNDEPVFANIVDEIDGRASIIYAQDFLSFLGGGKGVLLAGVAGLNPCEVLIIGDGNEVYAAASAALDAGAEVTLMNNDISALQVARQYCGAGLSTIAIHPRVLYNKVKTADVIILGTCTRQFEMPRKLSLAMKSTAYVLNLEETHPSVTVPRTVAMALSNVLVNFFDEMIIKEGFEGMVATTPGMQCGMAMYRGKLVDKLIASYLHMPCVDLGMMISARN